MTDMMWSFGQFIDHDLDLTPITQFVDDKQPGFKNSLRTEEKIYIEVPDDDFYFDEKLEFVRATLYEGEQESPAPNHLNQHSAYLDLGQVYGVDFLRANTLRSFKDGKLKMGPGNLLPKNKLSGKQTFYTEITNYKYKSFSLSFAIYFNLSLILWSLCNTQCCLFILSIQDLLKGFTLAM